MWNESAQNLVDIRISSWILSSIYPMCSSFSLARTTTRTLRMVIKGDGRRLFCFCKSTRSFARFKAFCALFFSREKERMREKNNVTHRTVQLHKNTKLPKRSFAHMLSLSTDDTHRCTALCFSPSSSIASFLTRKKRKSMMPSSRSNDDARHKVSCSLSVSDRVYYCFTCAKIREIFEKIERRFSFERKGNNFIPQKLEKSIHFESSLFLLLHFKWRSAAEEDSGALRTSRNPRSGKRRRRRSEEEEEALHQVVREDSVPLPINKEVLEVCLVNRRVGWSEGLDNNNNNKPEVASWVDSGSRNNKPGASRRERVRFVNFAYRVF